MMTSIYKDRYVEIFLDSSKYLIIENWKETTVEMFDDEQIFKDFLIKWVDLVIQYRFKYCLSDLRLFRYVVPPEIQENEIKVMISQASLHGFEKQAFVVTDDFIQLLMMEQAKDEYTDAVQREASNFFLSKEEAIQWLLSTENNH